MYPPSPKRRSRETKWGWYCIYPILLHQLVAPLQTTQACWGHGAPNYGGMTSDYDLIVGSELVLNCSVANLTLEIKGYKNRTFAVNSSNLVFIKSGQLTTHEVRQVDVYTSQLVIPNVTRNDSGFYYCGLNVPGVNNEPVVCTSKVAVGSKPLPVRNFTCISDNMENLTCWWSVEPNDVLTTYTLKKGAPFTAYFQESIKYEHCPADTSNNTYCQWRSNSDPTYGIGDKILYFEVQGNNSLGYYVEKFVINHYEIVKPKSPENLTADDVGQQYIRLSWSPPEKLSNISNRPFLMYQLFLEESGYYPINRKIILLGEEVYEYTLEDLIPFMAYNISIRCCSNVTAKENMWSPVTTLKVRTFPDAPYLPPEVNAEAYELQQYEIYRTVTLYWKPVPEKYFNGENFYYHIQYFQNATSENSVRILLYQNSTVPFATINNLQKYGSYIFQIYSANSEGVSSEFETILIDSQKNIVPGPEDITAISNNPGHYEISWSQPDASSISTYVMFWCPSLKPWQRRCDGSIEWLSDNLISTSAVLNLSDSTTNYQFAVVAKTPDGSSGMQWASCIVPSNGVLGKITYLLIEQKDAYTLKVIWKLDCAAQKAVVKNFQIVYCKVAKTETCNAAIAGPNAESYLLQNLHPYSNYSVMIRAFNLVGIPSEDSDPKFQDTLQGAPSDAPRITQIVAKNNASIRIVWEPPQEPNGIITHYHILYSNVKQILEVNETNRKFYKIDVSGLKPFTTYTIRIEACVNKSCSPLSLPSVVRTDVGVPHGMDPPRVEPINSTHLKISWTTPSQANGPIDLYEIEWMKVVHENLTSHYNDRSRVMVNNSRSTIVEVACPELVDGGIRYLFAIRAANKKNGEMFFSSFSDTTEATACNMSQGVAMVIGVAIGSTLALAVFLLLVYKLIKWMSDKIHQVKSITVRLPKGLEGPETNPLNNYENFKNGPIPQKVISKGSEQRSYIVDDSDNKNRHGSGSSQYSSSSTDELIYKKGKCTKFGRKPSGESSGCSSMSSAMTRVHLSSDSGTESDFAVTPSPDLISSDQNVHAPHKFMLPILLEDQQGPERPIEYEQQENNNNSIDNVTITKAEHPYSKFGIAGNPLEIYSCNLAKSEPSVFDFSHTAFSDPVEIAPYSKFGLGRSSSDLSRNQKNGYSKFGYAMERSNPFPLDPSLLNPTVAVLIVDSPAVRTVINGNEIPNVIPELGSDNFDGNCKYAKIGVIPPLTHISPGYVSFNDMKNNTSRVNSSKEASDEYKRVPSSLSALDIRTTALQEGTESNQNESEISESGSSTDDLNNSDSKINLPLHMPSAEARSGNMSEIPSSKRNGYVPLSSLSDAIAKPNPGLAYLSENCPDLPDNYITPSNKMDLRHLQADDMKEKSLLHQDAHAGKLLNGVNYMNGPLHYMLQPLPMMESEICEV